MDEVVGTDRSEEGIGFGPNLGEEDLLASVENVCANVEEKQCEGTEGGTSGRRSGGMGEKSVSIHYDILHRSCSNRSPKLRIDYKTDMRALTRASYRRGP